MRTVGPASCPRQPCGTWAVSATVISARLFGLLAPIFGCGGAARSRALGLGLILAIGGQGVPHPSGLVTGRSCVIGATGRPVYWVDMTM